MSGTSGHVWAPERYVEWLNQHIGFNPRSQQHSNALSAFMLDDLRLLSPRLDSDFRNGLLMVESNANVSTRIIVRNVDLVLRASAQPRLLDQVRAAIEHKTLMTAHGKARKNRYGDIIAYANHVHNHSSLAIAAASVVVNTSPTYTNPDQFASGLVRAQLAPDRWRTLIKGTIALFTGIPLREQPSEPNDQPEALTAIVVDYDGQHPAQLVIQPPAPQLGEPAHVLSFYERIIRLYKQRF